MANVQAESWDRAMGRFGAIFQQPLTRPAFRVDRRAAVTRTLRGRALGVLLGLGVAASRADAGCANPFVDRTPLTDLGTGTYNGYQGGLYPGGTNERPASHDRDLDRTGRLLLLDAAGNPDALNGV